MLITVQLRNLSPALADGFWWARLLRPVYAEPGLVLTGADLIPVSQREIRAEVPNLNPWSQFIVQIYPADVNEPALLTFRALNVTLINGQIWLADATARTLTVASPVPTPAPMAPGAGP